MNKLVYTLAAISLFAAFDLQARGLDATEALDRASKWMQSDATGMRKAPAMSQMKLAYTAEAEKSAAPAFYVFSKADDGFMIVSADDRLPAVLGYTDSGSFDYEAIPENLRWWLGEYRKEIDAYLSANTVTAVPVNQQNIVAKQDKPKISNLVTAKWNQSSPYNDNCPTDAGGRCVTGCAATALAQILYYHKYPTKGTGTYSYTWEKQGTTLSFDYGNTTFDWANMRDTYDSSSTTEQKQAVATLMHACGVGIAMDYSSRESGATNIPIPRFLTQNMGYDAGVHIENRIGYSLSDWQELVYNELAANRPVLLTGQATNGGHAFVCDGYDGNDYFHINWGWGGAYDGAFLLNALNPEGQGIGGYAGGYNSSQAAIVGIQRDKGAKPYPSFHTFDDSRFYYDSDNNWFTLKNFGNTSYFTLEGTLGVLVTTGLPQEGKFFGNTSFSLSAANVETGQFSFYPSVDYGAVPTGLAAGSYKVYPAVKTKDGVVAPVLVPYSSGQYVNMTVDANGRIYYNGNEVVDSGLAVTEFYPLTTVYPNEAATYVLKIKNGGTEDYDGLLRIVFEKDGNSYFDGSMGLQLGAGQSVAYNVSLTLKCDNGVYDVRMYDSAGTQLHEEPFKVTVGEGEVTPPSGDPVFVVTGFDTPDFYYGLKKDCKIYGKNTTSDEIKLALVMDFYDESNNKILSVSHGEISLPSKFEGSVSFGDNYNLKPGTFILTLLNANDNNRELCDPITVHVYDESEGLWYSIAGGNAFIGPSYFGNYTGTLGIIDIPETVKLDGKTYSVTSISDGVFANMSDVNTVFLRSATPQFADAVKVFGNVGNDVTFYTHGVGHSDYRTLLSSLDCGHYATIESLTWTSGDNLSGITAGNDYIVDINFNTASATRAGDASGYVNPSLDITVSDTAVLTADLGEFANGSSKLTLRGLKEGSATVTVKSQQPGTEKYVLLPVSVKGSSTGVETVAGTAISVVKSADELTISGVEAGNIVEIYNLNGTKVFYEVSDGGGSIFRPDMKGVYLLKAAGVTLKISF